MRESETKMAYSRTEMMLQNGYTLNQGTSTLIKELRRGNEFEAHYWAKQLERSGFHKYLWRRLRIFCSEDVGLANPDLVVQVAALAENYDIVKKESRNPKVDESIIAMAIMLIARSPKTRAADDLLNVWRILCERWGYDCPMPDYAMDFHTKDGKRLPKRDGVIHWIEEASQISNDVMEYDWRLWLLRQAHDEWGYSTREEIEAKAREWDDKGLLRYGIEGWWPQSWMLPVDQTPTLPQADGSLRPSDDLLPGEIRVESVGNPTMLFVMEDEQPEPTEG